MCAFLVPPPGCRCIVVDGLRLAMFIGVLEREQQARQEVSITLLLMVPDDAGVASDDIADHVSYAGIVEALRARAASTRHVKLVETLADEIARMVLADARVESVVVDVRKTEIIPEANSVGVIIHRRRGA